MQTENGLKRRRINHLRWCLEQLKFYETALPEERFEELYRYICTTISQMEELDAAEANEYFLQQMRKKDIIDALERCNIELEI